MSISGPTSLAIALAEQSDLTLMAFARADSFLLSSASAVKHVLQDNPANYTKDHGSYKMLRRLFGNGLITSEGSFWLRQRRLAQPAFHRERIAAMGALMSSAAQQTVRIDFICVLAFDCGK